VLRQVFNYFDNDGSGSINAKEMDKVLSKLNVNLSRSQLEKMMRDCDLDSKTININTVILNIKNLLKSFFLSDW
jgi:Ca2+-binding EF-hand superfamily protein